jgi:hypothetical protein
MFIAGFISGFQMPVRLKQMSTNRLSLRGRRIERTPNSLVRSDPLS